MAYPGAQLLALMLLQDKPRNPEELALQDP